MTPSNKPDETVEAQIRPVGTWVVAGFLLTVTLVMWSLVAFIFHVRS